MQPTIETKRLIIREILPVDEQDFFELDSNPDVHKFLGNNPVKDIQQIKMVIEFVRKQYDENGIGRWAVIEKNNNEFIGWAGLKLVKDLTNNHINFYDLGYRLKQKHWGKGFATEASREILKFGFETLKLKEIFATTESANSASNHVLKKVGFNLIEQFMENNRLHNWFKIENNK